MVWVGWNGLVRVVVIVRWGGADGQGCVVVMLRMGGGECQVWGGGGIEDGCQRELRWGLGGGDGQDGVVMIVRVMWG